MSATEWILALALLCILEGIIPFVAPQRWIQAVRDIGKSATPEVVRKIGLTLLIVGVTAIWLITA